MAERRLIGFRHSIYTWIARLVMAELDLDWVDEEVDPFQTPPAPRLSSVNPAGKVPVLVEGDFVLSETRAITLYLAEGSSLIPSGPGNRARMHQIIALMDGDGYWPLVRQVYGQAVFGPEWGQVADRDIVAAGLARAEPLLRQLECLCAGAEGMVGHGQSLADCHVAPMLHAFSRYEPGAAMIARFDGLNGWLAAQQARAAFERTRPPFPA